MAKSICVELEKPTNIYVKFVLPINPAVTKPIRSKFAKDIITRS